MILNNNSAGKRIDVFLNETFPYISRNKIKDKIYNGDILINYKKVKPSYKLKIDDSIHISENFSKNNDKIIDIVPQDIDIDVVYEDDSIIIVNKEQGMVMYPATNNYKGTLVNALLYRYGHQNLSDIGGYTRPGIVHRIDKNTSGLVLIAKNNEVHKYMIEQFQKFKVKKEYIFICHGTFDKEIFTIKNRIGRSPSNRIKMAVIEKGKIAQTTFMIIKELQNNISFGEAILKTGRTHQIRVQLAHINHPILGDSTYSDRKDGLKGQLLHAKTLGFIHPVTKKYMEVTAKLPERFNKFLENKISD